MLGKLSSHLGPGNIFTITSLGNLVLYLDAGKSQSYPGSGTTWYDLSGNGNNATLYNGPTFTSGTNDSGSLILDGANDTIDTGMTIQAASNSTLQSFGAWMYGSGTDYSFFGSNASGSIMKLSIA